jgi:FkbM family methyltransferase
VGLREAFVDRIVAHVDPPTQAKFHWRARLRRGSPHARVMSQLARPGDTAIDIGANWGLYTFGLSELVGPDGHVIAVEPGPELTSLRATCARRANVQIYPLALSDRDGTGNLAVPEGPHDATGALAHIVTGDASEPGVTQVRLARLDGLDIPERARLSFIKCDVEGHEDAVLHGGERLFRERLPALLIELEERHREQPVGAAFELLASWGYAGFALTSGGTCPIEEFDLDRDQRAHLIDGELPVPTPPGYVNDFLFLPPGTRVPFPSGD